MIISLNGGESENTKSAHKDGRLCEILAGYSAFDAPMNNQKTECYTAESPSESKISLQQDNCIPETFFLNLMRLRKEKLFISCIFKPEMYIGY